MIATDFRSVAFVSNNFIPLKYTNNNYLASKLAEIKGLDLPWDSNLKRIEQVRYSWSQLCMDTGLSTTDLARKLSEYGLQTDMERH